MSELRQLSINMAKLTVEKYRVRSTKPPWQNPYVERLFSGSTDIPDGTVAK
jgi:hypothetical protein